jgi:hypothetical protein
MAKTKWTCEFCSKGYDAKEDADKCEAAHGAFVSPSGQHAIILHHPRLGPLVVKANDLATAISAATFGLYKKRQ